MRIGVIGIRGVGMAHVIAAAKDGHEIAVICDNNQQILENAKMNWVNKWDHIYEETEIQPNTVYVDNYEKINQDLDVLIICTPPNNRSNIIKYFLNKKNIKKILSEKPIELKPVTGGIAYDNVEICTEYIHSTPINQLNVPITSIKMTGPLPIHVGWDHELNCFLDLFPHMFSIIHKLGYDFLHIDMIKYEFENTIFNMVTDKGSIRCEMKWHEEHMMTINENILVDWEDDLFSRLINHGGMKWNEYYKIHNYIQMVHELKSSEAKVV